MDDLVTAGKVRYVGCSNTLAYQLARSLGRSELHGYVRFESVQPRYNLLFRENERELLPLCAEEDVADLAQIATVTLPWTPSSLPQYVTVVLDPAGDIAEVTELNNTVTVLIGGTVPTFPPPMILELAPNSIEAGGDVSRQIIGLPGARRQQVHHARQLEVAPDLDGDLAVQCALLHDVIEDAGISCEKLAAEFGPAVSDGVLALSKNNILKSKQEKMADSLARIKAQPKEI